MKTSFLILLLAGAAFSAQAQTRLIAFKSHSGSPGNYSSEAVFGNFGIYNPPQMLESVEKINDTTVVTVTRVGDEQQVDTMYHHPQFNDPNMTGDSLQKLYDNQVEFKNFSKKPPKPTTLRAPVNAPKQLREGKAHRSKKKDRKTFWFLLLTGGGTFLGTGFAAMVLRRRKAVRQYA